jgi:hypothetical protein
MPTTPTARTLALLRAEGWLAQVVEVYLAFCRQRRDLFGVGDVLAVRPGAVLLVQCTTGDNLAARRTKALNEPRLRTVLESGVCFELWGWSKRGAAGKRKLWDVRREPLALADLDALLASPGTTPAGPNRKRPPTKYL